MLGFSSSLLPGWQGSPTESGHGIAFCFKIFLLCLTEAGTLGGCITNKTILKIPLLTIWLEKTEKILLVSPTFPSDCQAWVHYAGMLSVSTGARYYIFLASDWLIISNLGLWLATDCQPEYHCNISLVFTRPASHCTNNLVTTLFVKLRVKHQN